MLQKFILNEEHHEKVIIIINSHVIFLLNFFQLRLIDYHILLFSLLIFLQLINKFS